MLTYEVIGPGETGNYLAGYFRPGTRTFVPLCICDNERQAYQETGRLHREARERDRASRAPDPSERRIISEFYREA